MPRMRTLKPDACTSESLALVDRAARWTFGTLWTHCDDEGRAVYNLRIIKAALYPLDDDVTADVLEGELAELEAVGCLCMYEVEGKKYLHVPAWSDHQHPNRKVPSRIPPCPKTDHTVPTHAQSSEDTVSAPTQLTPVVVVVDVDGGAQIAEPPRTRGSRLPDNWRPKPEDIEWQRSKGIPDALARRALEKFSNHWAAKAGRDAVKLDWSKTWRNWLLTEQEREPGARPTKPTAAVNAMTALSKPGYMQ